MCVIIYKEKSSKIPTKEYLKKAWNTNPHGAGFMFNNGDEIIGFKGFENFDDFYKKLKETKEKYDLQNKNIVFHFRIATHGGINKENTQPFPITNNENELKAVKWTAKNGFAHNGMLSNFGSKNSYLIKNNGNYSKSDTADFDYSILSNLTNFDTPLLDVIANDNYSRFAILTPKKCYLYGNWQYDEKNELYLSNKYFLAPPPPIIKKDTTATATAKTENQKYYDDLFMYDELNKSKTYGWCNGCNKYKELYFVDDVTTENYCKECFDDMMGNY